MRSYTKAELAERALTLSRKLNSVTAEVVPYTVDEDVKAGTTLMIRVPRLFFPR